MPVRHDGRVSPHQLRDSAMQRSPHSRSDGSALWRQGGTAVLACVYGPRPPASMASEDPERCVVEVAWRPRAGGAPGPKERALEAAVARCAQGALLARSHPRCAVLVALQVLSDDGGALACGVNAACAAMVDAGLPMAFMFGAVACALSSPSPAAAAAGPGGGADSAAAAAAPPSPLLLLDPDADEEAKAAAVLVAAYPYRAVLAPGAAADNDGGGRAAADGGDDDDESAAAPNAKQQQQQQRLLRVSEGALVVDLRGRAGDASLALGMRACHRGVEALAAFARAVVAEGVALGQGEGAAAAAAAGAPSASKKARKEAAVAVGT